MSNVGISTSASTSTRHVSLSENCVLNLKSREAVWKSVCMEPRKETLRSAHKWETHDHLCAAQRRMQNVCGRAGGPAPPPAPPKKAWAALPHTKELAKRRRR
jgi:hypothetical protein